MDANAIMLYNHLINVITRADQNKIGILNTFWGSTCFLSKFVFQKSQRPINIAF